jgi:hypothetical protein
MDKLPFSRQTARIVWYGTSDRSQDLQVQTQARAGTGAGVWRTLILCRHVYNAAIEERREAWPKSSTTITYY